jgi:hypothetical protein
MTAPQSRARVNGSLLRLKPLMPSQMIVVESRLTAGPALDYTPGRVRPGPHIRLKGTDLKGSRGRMLP